MKLIVITNLIALALSRRSGDSSAEASTYIEYDSDWHYDPGPSYYDSSASSAQSSTYIEYNSDWHYDPGPSHYRSSSYYDSGRSHYQRPSYYDSDRSYNREQHHHHHHHDGGKWSDDDLGFIFAIVVTIAIIGFVCVQSENQRKNKNRELTEAFKREVVNANPNDIDFYNNGRAVFVKG